MHVVDHCNLNCVSCNHFAPLAKPWFITKESLSNSLNLVKENIPNVKNLILLGGEPTLHPELLDLCKIDREILPDIEISILSNGKNLSQGEKQLNYLNHKINILRNLCGKNKPYFNFSEYNKNNKIYFKATKTSCEFYDLYNLFYKDDIKHINNVLNLITEVSLAYWIMDDGYCYKYNSSIGQRCQYTLNTQSFTKEENETLISFFKENIVIF